MLFGLVPLLEVQPDPARLRLRGREREPLVVVAFGLEVGVELAVLVEVHLRQLDRIDPVELRLAVQLLQLVPHLGPTVAVLALGLAAVVAERAGTSLIAPFASHLAMALCAVVAVHATPNAKLAVARSVQTEPRPPPRLVDREPRRAWSILGGELILDAVLLVHDPVDEFLVLVEARVEVVHVVHVVREEVVEERARLCVLLAAGRGAVDVVVATVVVAFFLLHDGSIDIVQCVESLVEIVTGHVFFPFFSLSIDRSESVMPSSCAQNGARDVGLERVES